MKCFLSQFSFSQCFNYSKRKATATVVNKLVLKWEINLDYLNEHSVLTKILKNARVRQNRKIKEVKMLILEIT